LESNDKFLAWELAWVFICNLYIQIVYFIFNSLKNFFFFVFSSH
jgi:hypothetical protein